MELASAGRLHDEAEGGWELSFSVNCDGPFVDLRLKVFFISDKLFILLFTMKLNVQRWFLKIMAKYFGQILFSQVRGPLNRHYFCTVNILRVMEPPADTLK